jgi:HD-like signal output (HDOD) protein
MKWHTWWRETQWTAYLEHMELPVLASSQQALVDLEASRGEMLAASELADLLLNDPLLALRLLKDANQRLPRHLSRDITTPLGIVLALGTERFRQQIDAAPKADSSNTGFFDCLSRAVLSARIATALAGLHYDLDPGEVALATLLSNAGEMELWAFAPDLPHAAREELHSGRATRSEQAQFQTCGFAFKSLTLLLIEHWNLPTLIRQLIRGDTGQRAQLARLARDMARHISHSNSDPALPDDVRLAAKLTNARMETVIQALPVLNEADKSALLDALTGQETAAPE